MKRLRFYDLCLFQGESSNYRLPFSTAPLAFEHGVILEFRSARQADRERLLRELKREVSRGVLECKTVRERGGGTARNRTVAVRVQR